MSQRLKDTGPPLAVVLDRCMSACCFQNPPDRITTISSALDQLLKLTQILPLDIISPARSLRVTCSVRIACERDDSALRVVAAVDL